MRIWRDFTEITGQVITVVIMIVLCDQCACVLQNIHMQFYRGADNSLARPGRKQATVTEDFDVHIPYLLS
jgi:hypothetical protein